MMAECLSRCCSVQITSIFVVSKIYSSLFFSFRFFCFLVFFFFWLLASLWIIYQRLMASFIFYKLTGLIWRNTSGLTLKPNFFWISSRNLSSCDPKLSKFSFFIIIASTEKLLAAFADKSSPFGNSPSDADVLGTGLSLFISVPLILCRAFKWRTKWYFRRNFDGQNSHSNRGGMPMHSSRIWRCKCRLRK